MKLPSRIGWLLLALVIVAPAQAQYLDVLQKAKESAQKAADKASTGLGQTDYVQGMRTFLTTSLTQAGATLAKPGAGGAVTMPASFAKLETAVRAAKQAGVLDQFNTAVGKAVASVSPDAARLLADAAKSFTPVDITALLAGAPDAITQEFRRATETKVKAGVKSQMQRAVIAMGVEESYGKLLAAAGQAAAGLDPKATGGLEDYLTGKTLDSVYAALAKAEAAVRANPQGATDAAVQQLFAAFKK